MFKFPLTLAFLALLIASLVVIPDRSIAEPPAPPDFKADSKSSLDQAASTRTVSLETAKDRAKLLQETYAITLEVLHHRYFLDPKAMVPARALEDVFAERREQSGVETRWISGNLDAMNIKNEPKSDFEFNAVKQFKQGESVVEAVESGVYRRAMVIPLKSDCINCHTGFFRQTTKTPKFAGLVTSIPIQPSTATETTPPPSPSLKN